MENIILQAVILRPKEPKLTVHSFLAPIVEELQELWKGVPILLRSMNKTVIVRLVVICIACDIPVAWKICGFASHMFC